jgi:hypothetical protein
VVQRVFLDHVPENQRTLALARRWLGNELLGNELLRERIVVGGALARRWLGE